MKSGNKCLIPIFYCPWKFAVTQIARPDDDKMTINDNSNNSQ